MFFVVFEGIDGSGKTTVSNQVAKGLRARGIPVEHVREGGTFVSPMVNRMREFGKNARNMAMTPEAELFFYLARDVQVASESIRPALDTGALVIADRYLYSYEVLGHFGRELPREYVQQAIQGAADGLWPDMVYLMDIDPYVARARRRVSKLVKKGKRGRAEESSGGGSRKGLRGGLGLQHHLREGYLELATADSRRWTVIDNGDPRDPDSALYAVVSRITDQINKKWQDLMSASHHVLGAITSIRRANTAPVIAAAQPTAIPISTLDSFEDARRAFYEKLRARAAREVAVAAYFLARLNDSWAWKLRSEWCDLSPEIVAYGLRGMNDERAWRLREHLVDRTPHHVVRSLSGPDIDRTRAFAMRERYLTAVPGAALATLSGDESPEAWSVRERLIERCDDLLDNHLDRVLPSLTGSAAERAWELREQCLSAHLHTLAPDPRVIGRVVKSLRGLNDTRSWELRNRYMDLTPVAVLSSLEGLDDERSWAMRERYVDQAPKVVLRTFDRSADERAWELRFRYAERVKEVFDSIDEMDCAQAWELRSEYLDNWPSTVVKSLGALGLSHQRGVDVAMRAMVRHPDNISLLKHLTRLVGMGEAVRAADDRNAS